MEAAGAEDDEQRLENIRSIFNIRDLDQPIKTLSGGERKRVALAFLLIDEPDLLLLDEPTNHLDVEMIEWLENYLLQTRKSIFMVTHDRYRSEEHTSELQSRGHLVCRLLLEK